MRVAVLGGTGFMGYDFVRRLRSEGRHEPVVYCTGAKSLVNLARHPIDARLVSYDALPSTSLEPDVEVVVNYAHPFSRREGLAPEVQIERVLAFLARALSERPDRRLVHVSTMSVYEPFEPGEPGREWAEADATAPPRSDAYAWGKHRVETALRGLPGAGGRLLVLRPTVVYGPFCRPWTDGPLAAFASGDVPLFDGSGRVQPLFVGDASRFVCARLDDFATGVYNLAGPEAISWREFLEAHGRIVGRGRLVPVDALPEADGPRTAWARSARNAGLVLRHCASDPAFKELVRPALRWLPRGLVERAREKLGVRSGAADAPPPALPSPSGPYARRFFARDRLVCARRFRDRFGDFELTRFEETAELLSRYHRWRFTDASAV